MRLPWQEAAKTQFVFIASLIKDITGGPMDAEFVQVGKAERAPKEDVVPHFSRSVAAEAYDFCTVALYC